MRKWLYYIMLFGFFVCAVWNALSKKDSIMGTGAYAPESSPRNPELVGQQESEQRGWESPGASHASYQVRKPRVSSKW